MNLKTKLMGLGLIAAGIAMPAMAKDTGFYVGANLSYASGMNLKKQITQQDLGFVLDGGYIGKLAATDIPVRTSLAYMFFPGKKVDGYKAELTGAQLAGDIFIKTPVAKLRLISGLSVNKWTVKVDPEGVPGWNNSVKGLKLGGRIGFDYTFNSQVSVEALLQAVELGTDQDLYAKDPKSSTLGAYGINPVWLQVGVKYHF